MLILSFAAFLYLALALGLVLAIDNLVGFVFPENSAKPGRLLNLGKSFDILHRRHGR
jgi:hypothetical protein